MGGEPYDCIGDSFGARRWDPGAAASAMVQHWVEVVAFNCMGGPGSTLIGKFVDEELASQWSQRSSIEVEGAFELFTG